MKYCHPTTQPLIDEITLNRKYNKKYGLDIYLQQNSLFTTISKLLQHSSVTNSTFALSECWKCHLLNCVPVVCPHLILWIRNKRYGK